MIMFRRFDPVILILLMVSLGANTYIYHQSSVRHAVQRPVLAPLKIGDKIPPMRATTLDGSVIVEPSGERVVFYFFSPTCSWCERNLANARAIAAGARNGRYKFIAISTLDIGLREYATARGLDWTVATNVPPATLAKYKVVGTPQTTVVSPSGIVLASWSGAYSDSAAKEIRNTLGISVPVPVALR
jgi:peroxiredoxin